MVICGTGHRPDKLGDYSNAVADELMYLALNWLIANPQVKRVISGGALGWDQALARAAYAHGVFCTLDLPFPGFEDRWPAEAKSKLHALMHKMSYQFVNEGPYVGWKMQARNAHMVDRSDLVLALWDGSAGGTGNCVRYAESKKKPIVNLWDEWQESNKESNNGK